MKPPNVSEALTPPTSARSGFAAPPIPPSPVTSPSSSTANDTRWRECPCHAPFSDFINLELLPWIESLHPLTKHRNTTALIGLSYTGLAAAYTALRAPNNFTHVIAQSGSFWSDDCALAKSYLNATALPRTAFYLEVGTLETNTHIQHKPDILQVRSQIDGVRTFRDALLARGLTVHYFEFDGAHEFTAWKRTLPAALTWALSVTPR